MRSAIGSSVSPILANGDTVGINLGADYCSEHEWGIKGLRQSFGVGEGYDAVGISSRRISRLPSAPIKTFGLPVLALVEHDSVLRLFFSTLYGEERDGLDASSNGAVLRLARKAPQHVLQTTDHFNLPYLHLKGRQKDTRPGFAAAWDERSFAVAARGAAECELLTEVANAFDRRDVLISVGSGMPFQNGGLCLVIASKVPADVADALREADEDDLRLKRAAQATGIHAVLEKAGCRYFALSPRWADKTKSDVIFWLNPMDQQNNNYGWFRAGDLHAWAQGRGPIPKEAAARRSKESA